LFVGGEDLLDVSGKTQVSGGLPYRFGTEAWRVRTFGRPWFTWGTGKVWGGLLGVLTVKSGVVCGLRASWSL